MEVQSRVPCWHHTRYLIIISQTITRLIVIGEILVRREEKCQVHRQRIFIHRLAFFFFFLYNIFVSYSTFVCRPHLSPLSNSCGITNNTSTNSPHSDISPKDELEHPVTSWSSLFPIVLYREEEKGVKGHLKAKVNGEAF